MLSHNQALMLTPSQARERAAKLSPEELSQIVGRLVSEKVEKILDEAVVRTVACKKTAVQLVLGAKDCTDNDANIRDFLVGSGYADVHVTSDFPGYNESYSGTTTIKFSIPSCEIRVT